MPRSGERGILTQLSPVFVVSSALRVAEGDGFSVRLLVIKKR